MCQNKVLQDASWGCRLPHSSPTSHTCSLSAQREGVEPTNKSSAGRPYFKELFRDGRGVSDFNPLLTFSLSKNDFLRGSAEIGVWVQICFFAASRLHSALDVMPKNTACIEKPGGDLTASGHYTKHLSLC